MIHHHVMSSTSYSGSISRYKKALCQISAPLMLATTIADVSDKLKMLKTDLKMVITGQDHWTSRTRSTDSLLEFV